MSAVRVGVAIGVAAALGGSWNPPASAHLGFISPYTFNRHALPILQERCGACHAEGGISGLPLLRYEDAERVSWPIRQALTSGRMPPWFAEGATPFKAGPHLSARELDVLMSWAAGGSPQDSSPPRVPASSSAPSWGLGQPDVVLPMPEPFTLENAHVEALHEVTLAARSLQRRLIRAVDLSPGASSIARSAEIVMRTREGDEVIGLWQPGDTPQVLEANAAFQVPPDASFVLRMRYRRSQGAPVEAVSDRSQVGLYFAPGNARPVRVLDVRSEGHRVDRTTRAVALRPVSGPVDGWVQLTVVAGNGSRTPFARIQLREGWARRYVFSEPIRLSRGTRIEAAVTPSEGAIWASLTGDRQVALEGGGPLHVAIEVVD